MMRTSGFQKRTEGGQGFATATRRKPSPTACNRVGECPRKEPPTRTLSQVRGSLYLGI
jgi:hypothetical protein